MPIRVFTLVFIAVAVLLLSACRKFEGDQTVPAYLRIDSIGLQTTYFDFGSNTHNITDAWVYVNDQLIGVFELPATFPVLARGKNKLEIRPGIKLNGISATRVPYPFYKPHTINDFNFVEDSIISINPVVTYHEYVLMPWVEDFDQISIGLERTGRSDTGIFKTTEGALQSEFSSHSGKVQLTGNARKFELATTEKYSFPKGQPVFLEIDYKCEKPFGVGLIVEELGTITFAPLLFVNPTDVWNKIYINLGPNISIRNDNALFKVYFDGALGENDTEASYYFDNIKLVHR